MRGYMVNNHLLYYDKKLLLSTKKLKNFLKKFIIKIIYLKMDKIFDVYKNK